MNIFILEDMPHRINLFKKRLFNHNLFFASNVKDAIYILERNNFDIMFLDHDLDGKVYVNSERSNTGYQLVKYIIKYKIKVRKIFIHSLNIFGSALMKDLLAFYGYNVKRIIFPLLINKRSII